MVDVYRLSGLYAIVYEDRHVDDVLVFVCVCVECVLRNGNTINLPTPSMPMTVAVFNVLLGRCACVLVIAAAVP